MKSNLARFFYVFFATVALAWLACPVTPAQAATNFPNKPIQMIVCWGAGGGVDVTARVFGKYFEKYIKETVVIQNITGGGGSVGFTRVVGSRPDGYTLTMAASPVIQHRYTIDGVQYSPDSFDTLGMVTFDPVFLVVKAGSKYDMPAQDFFNLVKKNPGKILYGVGSHWGGHDFARAQLVLESGLEFQKVTMTKGGAEVVTNILGEHIDCGTIHYAEGGSHIQEGTLKVLAVSSDQRSALAPNAPTYKELGYNLHLGTWRGVLAPKGLPADVLAILRDAFDKAAADPALAQDLSKIGVPPVFLNWEKFATLMREEDASIKKVVDLLKAEATKESTKK